jgi:hypothetical protein
VAVVFRHEAVHALGQRARAHEGVEHPARLAHAKAHLLFGLGADAVFGRGRVQQAGRHLDQQLVVAVDEGGVAELAHQHHRAPLQVVQQDGGAVAVVGGFALHFLPAAVGCAASRAWC